LIGLTEARRSVTSPTAAAAAAADSTRHQQPGVESFVDEMKSEIQREMDRLNRRIDKIDKQMSTILQLLTINNGQAPREADNPSTDKKIPRAVHSPSFMHTITEQEEDVNSLLETIDATGNDARQWKMSKTEQADGEQLNSGGQLARSPLNDLEIL